MLRNVLILLLAGAVIALPFLFRQSGPATDWQAGDPELVIITPHNEAIRYEFARGFSNWHSQKYGRPVKVDWRAIGGTTEIMRYLASEYVNAARAWWKGQGKTLPPGAGAAMVSRNLDTNKPPAVQELFRTFRSTDDPKAFTCKIDLFFGGGEFDHSDAFRQGFTVEPWPAGEVPARRFTAPDGTALIPEKMSGETWRTATLFGNVLSTFGLCYNVDRLRELGVSRPPSQWDDLADPVYFRQVGAADPTKSGSIAKAFEMIVQQKCKQAVAAAGFSEADILDFESAIKDAKLAPGELPPDVPPEYQAAIEHGWEDGLRLVQRIGANARYFTDSSSKVPIDVSMGDAAVGLAIDFYGRYQAQCSRAPDGSPRGLATSGRERMVYVTPVGGSSVSCDPIGLLRGAEHRELAVRFIEFVLGEDGQRLWTYRPGTPGGPEKYALRRLPIRRDFYPPFDKHVPFTADDLADPDINPYSLATNFTYQARWTGQHFGVQRDLIKAMCLDSADELRAAWESILKNDGPEKQPEAMALLGHLPDRPEPLTWRNAPGIMKKYDKIEVVREWTGFYRENYRKVKEMTER